MGEEDADVDDNDDITGGERGTSFYFPSPSKNTEILPQPQHLNPYCTCHMGPYSSSRRCSRSAPSGPSKKGAGSGLVRIRRPSGVSLRPQS